MKLLTAGSLKVSELSAFLKASYEEQPATQIMGYTLDKNYQIHMVKFILRDPPVNFISNYYIYILIRYLFNCI